MPSLHSTASPSNTYLKMSTTRNTKGQFARKTAPKNADTSSDIKQVRSMLRKMDEKLNVCMSRTEDLRKCLDTAWSKREEHNNWLMPRMVQIQRDIDLLKSATVNEGRDTNVVTPPAPPEEPKAEPWKPKVGMHVVFLDNTWQAELHKGAIEVESGPDSDGHYKTIATGDYMGGIFFNTSDARPATAEEIAEAEKSEKLKKLVRGCRVETPYGKGIYLGFDGSGEGRYTHWVSLDCEAVPGKYCFRLDQLTPLT